MRISSAAAAGFCRAPDPAVIAVLLYGSDAGLVALRRQELVRSVTEGDEMRLTRLDAAEARKDPAAIDEAARARGFFPGRRVVLIERATDGLAKPLATILEAVEPEDALLVVEADSLPARSALRKLFETGRTLAAVALWPEPPDAGELGRRLRAAGLGAGLTAEAEADLVEAASVMDAGPLEQLIQTLAVYGLDREEPLGADELAALLPARAESGTDRLIAAVAAGEVGTLGPVVRRLVAAGVTPTTMLIQTGRHFRQLLGLAARNGPAPRGRVGERMAAEARRWGTARLERAVRTLYAADRTLRSPGRRPDLAMVERALIRVAMMAPQ